MLPSLNSRLEYSTTSNNNEQGAQYISPTKHQVTISIGGWIYITIGIIYFT